MPMPIFSANALDRISRSTKGVDVIVSAGCIESLVPYAHEGGGLGMVVANLLGRIGILKDGHDDANVGAESD